TDAIKAAVEHADDLGGLVADDRVTLLVPQHRHRNTAAVGGIGTRIELVQEFDAIDAVGYHTIGGREGPTVLTPQPMCDRKADHGLEALQGPEYKRPASPRACQRNIKMISADLRFESIHAGWPGRAIHGDPIAKLRIPADELPGRWLVGTDPAALD